MGPDPGDGLGGIVASAVDGIEPGGRYYGWYPMARYCSLVATATDDGLRDDGAHRADHASVYRSYVRTDLDPLYAPGGEAEDRHALLRGLFATAYLADDFFADADYFGASTAVVLSASSKTAIGFAQRAAGRGVEVVGLTSASNREFVEDLGCYERVLTYGTEEEIPPVDSVLVDMAGNGAVRERVHSHLGDRLGYSMAVGISHYDAPRGGVSAGPDPELFFAPTQVKLRTEELGRERYQRQLGEALDEFVGWSEGWLELERSSGPEDALAAYRSVLNGETPPSVGRIVSLH